MTDDPLRRTLIAENREIQYDPEDRALRELARYPTVRQPKTVIVDPVGGHVFVTGSKDGTLQILDPR